ncbi:MAG: hypothetical protein H6870_18465 [Methylobacteriaceae bacterium]|nr:hypothetical protein [Methylobacteriaceae bacterium]
MAHVRPEYVQYECVAKRYGEVVSRTWAPNANIALDRLQRAIHVQMRIYRHVSIGFDPAIISELAPDELRGFANRGQ